MKRTYMHCSCFLGFLGFCSHWVASCYEIQAPRVKEKKSMFQNLVNPRMRENFRFDIPTQHSHQKCVHTQILVNVQGVYPRVNF